MNAYNFRSLQFSSVLDRASMKPNFLLFLPD